MKSFVLFCLGLILSSTALTQVAPYLASVVRIESQKNFGEDIGAGSILGREGEDLFILTAFHVVQEATAIEVSLYKQKEPRRAELVIWEEDLDLAVLKITAANTSYIETLYVADTNLYQMETPVRSIGHPAGGFWKTNFLNKILETELYEEERKFSITPQAIAGGCSGGPVFFENGAWLGMVTETSMVEGVCVKANVIREWLKKNQVPAHSIYSPKIEMVLVEGGKKKKENQPFQDLMAKVMGREDMQKVKSYYLARFELSIADFKAFAISSAYTSDAEKNGKAIKLTPDTIYNQKRPHYVNEYAMRLYYDHRISWRHDAYGKAVKEIDKYPVVNVSFTDAMQYCAWLSRQTGRPYRLPTGMELAYASFLNEDVEEVTCKPGNIFGYEGCEAGLMYNANFLYHHCPKWAEVEKADTFATITPFGTFPENSLGFFDLYGNVSEWFKGWNNPDEDIANVAGPNWATWEWSYAKEDNPEKAGSPKLSPISMSISIASPGGGDGKWWRLSEADQCSNFIGIRLAMDAN